MLDAIMIVATIIFALLFATIAMVAMHQYRRDMNESVHNNSTR